MSRVTERWTLLFHGPVLPHLRESRYKVLRRHFSYSSTYHHYFLFKTTNAGLYVASCSKIPSLADMKTENFCL